MKTARIYSHGNENQMFQSGWTRLAAVFILGLAVATTPLFAQAPSFEMEGV